MTPDLGEDGSLAGWKMTRREFYAIPRGLRNSPRRGDAPTRIGLCPKTGATVLVQVTFTCAHGTLEKNRCEACERA